MTTQQAAAIFNKSQKEGTSIVRYCGKKYRITIADEVTNIDPVFGLLKSILNAIRGR